MIFLHNNHLHGTFSKQTSQYIVKHHYLKMTMIKLNVFGVLKYDFMVH